MEISQIPVSVTVTVHIAMSTSCTLSKHFTNAMTEMLHIP